MLSLQIQNLSKSFGRRHILRNLNLSVTEGEVIGIVGGNGSGKSTLLKIIAGLLRPSLGQVLLTVDSVRHTEGVDRRRYVGFCSPDVTFYPELTAQENLAFFAMVASMHRTSGEINALLAHVGLAKARHERVGTFSSGMKQRLRIAFALLGGRSVLLLDEPTLALDSSGVRLIEETIKRVRERNGIVLLATNEPRETAWATRIIAVGDVPAPHEMGSARSEAHGVA